MSKKSRLTGPFNKQHGKRFPRTVEIWITAPLSYSMITAKPIALEKVCLIDMQNLGTTC